MTLGGVADLDHTVLLCTRMGETRAFFRDPEDNIIEIYAEY